MGSALVNVGIADIAVAHSPVVLRTILGSCVGICIYDSGKKIGAMGHIMLPEHRGSGSPLEKYADTAIPLMVEKLEDEGCTRKKMIAKIAGGATMFKLSENSLMGDIGKNNINKVKSVLKELEIELTGEDTGGDFGRTIDFYTENGEMKIKSLSKYEKVV